MEIKGSRISVGGALKVEGNMEVDEVEVGGSSQGGRLYKGEEG